MSKYTVTVRYNAILTRTATVEVEATDEKMAAAIVREMDGFGGLNWKMKSERTPYVWDVTNEEQGSFTWGD